jgi:mannosyltransferase
VLIGLLGFVISAAFAWVPSIWYDEAATVVSATRSWPELWRMVDSVDVVHAAYYALVHLWFDLVGYSPVSLRLPSAFATGLAAGGLVILGRALGGRRLGVIAGVAMCLFPRVTWMGEEGRSYALSVTLAVALTLVFLGAWARESRPAAVRARWWIGYAALAVASTITFTFLALLVVAHGITALWTFLASAAGRRRGSPDAADRRAAARGLVGWSVAAVASGLVCVPFALKVVDQSGQVGWIDPISARTFHGVFVTQLFPQGYGFATVAWALIALAVIVSVLTTLGRWPRPESSLTVPPRSVPTLVAVAVPFLVVPTAMLILASVLVDPLYSPRYLTFTAPGAALLVAVGIDALVVNAVGRARTWVPAVALVVLAAVAAPQIIAQRMPEAKQESSWAEVAELIAHERAEEPPGTSEAVIFGPVRRHPSASTRVIQYTYPDAFVGLQDVALKTPAAVSGQLWEEKYPVRESLDRLDDDTDVVWLITSNRQDWRPGITERLGRLGFTLDEEWSPTNVNVLRYRRDAP